MDASLPFDLLMFNDPSHMVEYFRVALRREYPDLSFEDMTGERRGWIISLPAQPTYTSSSVEAHCIDLQEKLFWEKDVLVHFVIARSSEELDD